MAALFTTLTDVSVNFGNFSWNIGSSFFVYLLIALIIGIIAEFISGWSLPFGLVGAVIAGIVGIWLMTKVVHINGGVFDWAIDGVPILSALIGAILLVSVWHLLTFRRARPRRRFGYRSY